MKPILFDKSATTFTSNGLGRLDFISCKVTEERNGIFELEAEIAESALHSSQLEMNSIICAPYYPGGSLQAFRVAQITKPISGKYKIYAQHLSYQLTLIPVMPFTVTAAANACQTTLNKFVSEAVENCPFTFTTDVTTVSSYRQTVPASIRSRMGGVEGSVIDQFGGEWEYDNYNVYLKNHRGVTTPTVTLRYGKNITDLEQEQNIESTITGIVPYWTDSEGGETITLPEKSIDSAYAGNYPFKRTTAYDFSGSFEEKPTESQLRTKAQAYVNSSGIGIPVVSIKVSFIDLAQTEEYKDVASLQNVKLCDVINVEFEKYGISTTAKVVKTVYDVLADRYESIEVGSTRTGLTSTISDMNANNARMIEYKVGQVSTEVQQDIDNATAWLTQTGGVIRALKNDDGEWTDLLCCSANATASTGNVFRLNVNGVGFSSTGWNGPFYQGWTLDGHILIGGTNAPSITVYDNNNNVIFQADATKIIWNATNSSMDSTGTITSKNGNYNFTSISNGSINFGYNNQVLATLRSQTATDPDTHQTLVYLYLDCDRYFLNCTGDIRQTTSGGKAVISGQRVDIYSNSGSLNLIASGNDSGGLHIETASNSGKDISINSDDDILIEAADDIGIQATDDVTISGNDIMFNCSRFGIIDEMLGDKYGRTTTITINGITMEFQNGLMVNNY